jgi:hypothetical protein
MKRAFQELHPLAVLLSTFAVLVLLHGWATPLFEAPDEVWHYAYVRWLVEGNDLPSMTDDTSGANQEVAQPPLYYAVAALLSAPFPDEDLQALFWHNPNFGYQAPGTVADNKNMLIHTEQERFPGSGAVLAIRVTRLTSLIFGMLTIIAAWGLGLEAFSNRRVALLTAALVAFQPQFVFMSSVVSNDSAAAALCTAGLWTVARILRHGVTPRNASIAGLVAGLAALTKTSVLLLLPLAGLCLLWQGFRQAKQVTPEKRNWPERYQKVLQAALAFGLTALLTGSWWYIRNLLLYGDPLGISNHTQTLWGRPAPVSLATLVPELPLLLRSFWGAYGWGHVWWHDWVYAILTLVALGTIAWGAYRLFKRNPTKSMARTTTMTTRAIYLLCTFWLLGVLAALLQWMRQVEAPHGRLLFPAIGAWAMLLTTGLAGAGRNQRWRQALVVLLLVIIATLAPGVRILATFAPPKLISPITITGSNTPVRYGDEALLLSARVEGNVNRFFPGDTFLVQACWQAERPISRDYTVFVQLLGPENSIISSRRTYPGLGRFPTSLWPATHAFCDAYRLTLPVDVDTPLRTLLEIGLFDATTGERLAAQIGESPLEPPVVTTVVVAAQDSSAPQALSPLAAQFENAISLRGYDREPVTQAGSTLTVTLYWEAHASIEESLIAFVHLWQPGENAAYAQHDSEPRNGWFPTTVWQTGDMIPDTHTLRIPSELPPGEYRLWAGLYRASDGTRIAVQEDGAPLPNALVPLGELQITARE